jgi:hypothetical protein
MKKTLFWFYFAWQKWTVRRKSRRTNRVQKRESCLSSTLHKKRQLDENVKWIHSDFRFRRSELKRYGSWLFDSH